MYNIAVPKIGAQIPRVKLKEAQQIIFERTGRDIRKRTDLDPEGEKECGATHKKIPERIDFYHSLSLKKDQCTLTLIRKIRMKHSVLI
jgi:hypothetical protein